MALPTTIATAALSNYQKGKMADAITSNIPLLKYFMYKNSIVLKGGQYIELATRYNKRPATSVDRVGLESKPFVVRENLAYSKWDWKSTNETCSIPYYLLDQAQGEFAKQDVIKAEIQSTVDSIVESLALQLAGDGTGNGGKDLMGIPGIISTTAGLTVGEIDSSTYTWWDNYRNTSVGSFSSNGLRELSKAIRAVERGSVTDKVDLIVAGSDVYGYMEDKAHSSLFQTNNRLGELGFDALNFKGRDVIHDPTITSTSIYGINTKHMALYILDASPDTAKHNKAVPIEEKMKKMLRCTGFVDQEAINAQPVMTAVIGTGSIQVATDDRARHFVLSGITA